MIKVIFKCNNCGCEKGNIITHERTTEVECVNCGIWETMEKKTDKN